MAPGHQVGLGDGRTLSYADLGDPDGAPVLYLHGARSSRNEATPFDDLARDHGLRLIATDRPGAGGSSPHPDRTFVGYASDLEQLADALGVGPFVVAGMSNGGAYALAAGHALGPRVRGVVLINSTTPVADRDARRALARSGRLAYGLMRVAPRLLGRRVASAALREVDDAKPSVRGRGPDAAVQADPELAALVRQTGVEASSGAHGAAYLAEEMALGVAPWGFDHRAVGQRVEIFTGDRDGGAPYARRWATELPDAGLHVFPGGHGSFLLPGARAQIVQVMADLVRAAPAS